MEKKIVVVSDVHLGVDDKYSECRKNRTVLIKFLNEFVVKKGIDEVVINGDFLDQWFLPADYKAEADSEKFYHQVAKNNVEVINAIKEIISKGVKVVYVPGNHDMTLSAEVLGDIIPGIIQSRESIGMGKYITGVRNEIVCEHSHRYELFCAPDLITNKDMMTYGKPILPPGYFYARIGVTSLYEHFPSNIKELPKVSAPSKHDENQSVAFGYYKTWCGLVNETFPVNESFHEKFINVAVDGFQGKFSLSELVPQIDEKGRINAHIYKEIQSNWEEVQRLNHINVPISSALALEIPMNLQEHIKIPKYEYFDFDKNIETVIFSHTHIPLYYEYKNKFGRVCKFANSGTWVDNNFDDEKNTATFAYIISDEKEDKVEVLKCVDDNGKLAILPLEKWCNPQRLDKI